MKNFAACIALLCLFCTLTSCADGPATSVSVLATTAPVPATSAPVPTASVSVPATSVPVPTASVSVPTASVPVPAAALFTPTVPSNFALEDFQNKEFAGEDDTYSIYLINRTGGTDAAPTGELLVFNKSTDQVMEMYGSFTVIIDGGTIVYDDGKGEYILLSIGTYTSRKAVVLSLKDKKQAVDDFCMSSGPNGDHLFWKNHIIVNNCDTFTNRPWGQGEAPGVTALDLEAGSETVIARSDLTHQFQVKGIEGDNLRYIETYVENEADWQTPDKQKTEERTYDLSSLSSSP